MLSPRRQEEIVKAARQMAHDLLGLKPNEGMPPSINALEMLEVSSRIASAMIIADGMEIVSDVGPSIDNLSNVIANKG